MASASRQNPAATGPTSVSRTSHGPNCQRNIAKDQRGKGERVGFACRTVH